ncbi:LLM class flavin-dependent oxidoreductase [Auritidibacter ignavus]|uniref:LLM class flavin-dependent oxidoreductase n=1 Tax=Auritidibacter ignavus TaxID=678932 RepID=UPI002449EEBD|nr:LLM class flavin-dependent oxidoreductase [Auritidibacter ignavus]WGH91526.1 LLM class flavin-dependent oxidoreductase [Auritidibacter ignavus]
MPEAGASTNYRVSILDLATVRHGQSIGDAVGESLTLAQRAEERGFHRIWFAEHHNMPSIASSATSVLLSHIGAHTCTIRLGSGGVMLPNHAPLLIAEQFGMLQELYGPRIDLGLGRAPGTDQKTLWALRRDPQSADRFPQDVVELQGYLSGDSQIPGVEAYPGKDTNLPIFILGSSHFGAQLAAKLGLPYTFASHFAPQMLESAASLYREHYEPSEQHPEPYFIAALNVIADETEEGAQASLEAAQRSRIRSFLGRGKNLSDDEVSLLLHSPAGEQVLSMLKYTAVGTASVVREYMDQFAERVSADELIMTNLAPSLQSRLTTLDLVGSSVINR